MGVVYYNFIMLMIIAYIFAIIMMMVKYMLCKANIPKNFNSKHLVQKLFNPFIFCVLLFIHDYRTCGKDKCREWAQRSVVQKFLSASPRPI
jgi:hypothetical protein